MILFNSFLNKSTGKSYLPPAVSNPFPLLWLSMVRVESGPWDGGMTLCFFCTAMLRIEPGIPMLSLKTPTSFLSSSSLSFEFLFQDASGSSLAECTVQGAASCISCLSICASHTNREKSKKTKHPVIPLCSGLRIIWVKVIHKGNLLQSHLRLWRAGEKVWSSTSLDYKKDTPPLKSSPLWAALLYFHTI